MESYKSYFDRQTISPELHEKLLAIGRQPRTERRHRPPSLAWKKWAALAACCVLVRHRRQRAGPPPQAPGRPLCRRTARGRRTATDFW